MWYYERDDGYFCKTVISILIAFLQHVVERLKMTESLVLDDQGGWYCRSGFFQKTCSMNARKIPALFHD